MNVREPDRVPFLLFNERLYIHPGFNALIVLAVSPAVRYSWDQGEQKSKSERSVGIARSHDSMKNARSTLLYLESQASIYYKPCQSIWTLQPNMDPLMNTDIGDISVLFVVAKEDQEIYARHCLGMLKKPHLCLLLLKVNKYTCWMNMKVVVCLF